MNKVILIGRFTRDPEVRYDTNSVAIARFSLAVDRKYQKQGEDRQADFINCVAFGKTAEFIEKYFKKGAKAAAVGRIQTGSYTNKEGQKVYTSDVVIEDVEFAESKGSRDNTQAAESSDVDGFMNIPDGVAESLPFM